MDSHLVKKVKTFPEPQIIRRLRLLLFAHILLVSFQVPFRAILIDTTYIRDILPFVTLCLLLGFIAINGRFWVKQYNSLLDKLVLLYLLYGIIMILFWVISGVSLIEAIREFRNHFFPVVLFFIAKKTLVSLNHRIQTVNIFSLIALILLLSVSIEYVLLKIIGLSPYIFPWYRYTFLFSERYIDNVTGSLGYILPEGTPVLGLLGWPHATAATLMVLFAFSYSFLLDKAHKYEHRSSLWIERFPMWFRYSIVFLTAAAVFLILRVKTHMVTFAFIILVLPFLTKAKNLGKNLLITFVLVIVILSNDFIYSAVIKAFMEGFITRGFGRESTIAHIISVNPLSAIVNQPIDSMLFGSWHSTGGSELRLLNYTLKFGLVWLLLFLGIFVVGFFYARKIISSRFVKSSDRLFALGSIGLLFICFFDMGHYARAMTWPIIDILAVCLGALVAMVSQLVRSNRIHRFK